MKKIFVIFSVFITFILVSSFSPDDSKIFNAKLIDINYYTKCNCSTKSPVLVRVTYSVDNIKVKDLLMKHKFSNGIVITSPVNEKDKKGNIVYNYCSPKEITKEFSTVFVSESGRRSNTVNVKIDLSTAEIIEGTAPHTVKVD